MKTAARRSFCSCRPFRQHPLSAKAAAPLKEGLTKTIAYFQTLLREPEMPDVVGNDGRAGVP
jgi:hypothetical protein